MNSNYVGQFVGVVPPSAFTSMNYPKQLLLMFDCLAIDLGQKGLNPEDSQTMKRVMGDIGWLIQSEMLTVLSGLLASNQLNPDEGSIEHAKETLGGKLITHERFNAYLLRKKGIDAVPIMNQLENTDIDAVADRDVVVRLTIGAFPVPSELTPWGAIEDFRRDEEARKRYWDLKQWINKTAKSGLKHYEVSDELHGLLNDYDSSMKLHKMKQKTGTLEVAVTTTATVAEGLVKFKWSDAAKSLFQAKRENIKLLEDELDMPGKEVAYIASAKNRFL